MKHLLLSLCLVGGLAFTAAAEAEEIINFESDYTIEETGAVQVTETILYDFGDAERHGLYRVLETDHPQPASAWYKKRFIDIELSEVTLNGHSVPYTLEERGEEIEIKIGDPNVFITGEQEYQIRYMLLGALSYGSDGAEFYYNVTGNGWDVPIQFASAQVTGDSGVLLNRSACYWGVAGSTERCTVVPEEASASVRFLVSGLAPGEGLTIAQEINPTQVATMLVEKMTLWFLFLGSFGLFVAIAGTYVYRFRNRHNPQSAIIAEYEPYPGVLPMYTGLLIDGALDPKDITAGLVYLAEQGFLKIKRTERKVWYWFEVADYEVTLLKPITETATGFHQVILELLFPEDTPGDTVALSTLKNDTARQRKNYHKLLNLRSALAKDLTAAGFYERLSGKGYWYLCLGALLVAGSAYLAFQDPLLVAGGIGLTILTLFVLLIMVHRRRTPKGFAALSHLKGFKDFLSVTDRERFTFHNAPEKNPEQFMAYLPYAIALGVEKEWSEVFKNVTIPQPNWYDGGSIGTFSAVSLSSDLNAFSSSFASSSGTSASSGGGASGGGGGGGGGGSW